MKNISKKICLSLIVLGTVFPLFVFAQTSNTNDASQPGFQIVPCSGAVTGTDPLGGTTGVTGCDYNALITTIQRIINLMLYASMFIAIILIVYAGFEWLTAGGDTGKVKTAIKIFKAVVIGMLIAFLSYAVVYYIAVTLKPNGTDSLINPSFGPVNSTGQPTTSGASSLVPLTK